MVKITPRNNPWSEHIVRLDEVDLKVLLSLIKDPRIQISELADEVGIAHLYLLNFLKVRENKKLPTIVIIGSFL